MTPLYGLLVDVDTRFLTRCRGRSNVPRVWCVWDELCNRCEMSELKEVLSPERALCNTACARVGISEIANRLTVIAGGKPAECGRINGI
jgi:hypothetical protein